MPLKPFQKGLQVTQTQTQGRLKPFVPVKRAPAPRTDIRQSDNYKNAVSNAEKYQKESDSANANVAKWEGVKSLPKEVAKMMTRSALGVADVVQRVNPVEFGKNIDAGIKKVFTGDKNVPASIRFQQGRTERQARPLMWEQFSGNKVTKDTGGVDWEQGRKFIGDAASAPTYAYSGSKAFMENPTGNILARILKRGIGSVPEAAVNTGIQQFQQGDTKNIGTNFRNNAVAMALFSNVFGEGGRAIRKVAGTQTPPQIEGGKSPDSEPQPSNLPSADGGQPTPNTGMARQSVAGQVDTSYNGGITQKPEFVNQATGGNHLLQEAGKYPNAEAFVKGIKKEVPIVENRFMQMDFTRTKDSLPPVETGYIRLYRAEGGRKSYDAVFRKTNISKLPKSFVEGDSKFYTPKLVDANVYAKEYGAKIHYIDVPNSLAQKINPSEYIVNKSQLTDLYHQARGGVPKTIKKIKNPINPTGKERGFIESVRNSPEISQDLASKVEGSSSGYEFKPNKPLQERSQRIIFDNITEAERIAKNDVGAEGGIMNTELIKHYDSIAQQAKRAGDNDAFEAAMNRADEITNTRANNLTDNAQNLQAAATISKLSPEGLLHYINKVSRDVGSPIKLSNDVKFDFMRKAEVIQNILDPREKAFKTFDLIDELAEALPRGNKDKFLEAINLPRAIMATADLSAPLRQGIFTAARNPVMFAKNFGKMFKYAFSEKAYRGLKADIITSPNYNLYSKHKLPLTDVASGLSGREEVFMSNLAEKIPLFGSLAKGSNRAYTGFLNKMRVDLFDDFVKTAKLNGIKDPKFLDDAARFVGAATGRGNLFKTLEGSAPALNAMFFSPRLMASRISLINPHYYMKLHPAVRKEALKSLGAFVGTGIGILTLAKANGAEVSADPRSADFGKIKMGNTRYDIWGGFQQYARLIGQLSTGEKISTITGKETTLGEGYNAPTHESIFMDFLKSKQAPLMSLLTRASQGEKYGEKFNLPAEVIDRFLPMIAGDAFDLYSEYGAKGLPGAIPGAFGIGSQTYGDQIPTMGTTEANNPTIKFRTRPGLGETMLNFVTGKQVSEIPKDQWEPLYEERKKEQIRQAEVDKVKSVVLISGETQWVGDTKIYLENGVVKTKKESKDKRLPLKDQLLYEELQKRKVTQPFYTK